MHQIEIPRDWKDYELLDSGNENKLERFGTKRIVRPEHSAVWKPALSMNDWASAHAEFLPGGGEVGGGWKFRRSNLKTWRIAYKKINFKLVIENSRQIGVFPEQAVNWDWIEEKIRLRFENQPLVTPIRVLNLFGYTGIATLAAASAGADVTHVDASRKAVRWARENQSLSGLEACKIRWLVDDAFKYVQREIRRRSSYEGIILDPPIFGRGPKGDVWQLLETLPDLLRSCRGLLSDEPLFLLLTTYGIASSSLSTHNLIEEMVAGFGGCLETGELGLEETSAKRILSLAQFSRWSAT